MRAAFCLVTILIAASVAFPQKEGNAYTNEAIRQAQQSLLIPRDAQIQKVAEFSLSLYSLISYLM